MYFRYHLISFEEVIFCFLENRQHSDLMRLKRAKIVLVWEDEEGKETEQVLDRNPKEQEGESVSLELDRKIYPIYKPNGVDVDHFLDLGNLRTTVIYNYPVRRA